MGGMLFWQYSQIPGFCKQGVLFPTFPSCLYMPVFWASGFVFQVRNELSVGTASFVSCQAEENCLGYGTVGEEVTWLSCLVVNRRYIDHSLTIISNLALKWGPSGVKIISNLLSSGAAIVSIYWFLVSFTLSHMHIVKIVTVFLNT